MPLNLKEVFEKYGDEYLKFEAIESPRSQIPDLCLFLMLAELGPATYFSGKHEDIVAHAHHDEIYLSAEANKVAENATEEQIRDMIRCGLRYDETQDCFCMFV